MSLLEPQISTQQKLPEISPRTGKPKRRKAIRACVHCQRTHLTCDNSRPCERCVDRGLADTCCDGTRKRAKYLGREEIKQELTREPPQPSSQSPAPRIITPVAAAVPVAPRVAPHIPTPANTAYLAPFDPTFQSSTADSEYNVLGSILHMDPNNGSPYDHIEPQPPADLTLDNFNIDSLLDDSPLSDWLAPKPPPISLTINQPLFEPEHGHPSQVYRMVNQPFPYTPGFHALFGYLKKRFKRHHLMQIVQSMAKYRPSFIAYASNLTQQDLIFLEQGFQRSLLEYQKYFSFSGTPTIIWRRTGQIAAVGSEFCMLTGYQASELVEKFIVELFDDQSTLAYFQTFSEIAFGDHHGVRMSACTLTTSAGKSVRTSSVLTLKRDMFGIPMLIIGNFLPILV